MFLLDRPGAVQSYVLAGQLIAPKANADARGPRMWMVMAPVQTDKTKESLAEAVKELGQVVADKPMTAEQITDAKDRMIKTLAGRWETSAAVAGALGEVVTFGLPDDYYVTYADRVRSATDAQVNAAAKKFVDPSRLTWVVIGDLAKIEGGSRS